MSRRIIWVPKANFSRGRDKVDLKEEQDFDESMRDDIRVNDDDDEQSWT